MSECEVCGKSVDAAKRAEIDGVILSVCDDCAKLGKQVYQPKSVMIPKSAAIRGSNPQSIESDKELAGDFSARIRKAREKMNLTQDEAADKMNISRQIYKRIESGFKPDDSLAKRIQRFYSIELYKNDNVLFSGNFKPNERFLNIC